MSLLGDLAGLFGHHQQQPQGRIAPQIAPQVLQHLQQPAPQQQAGPQSVGTLQSPLQQYPNMNGTNEISAWGVQRPLGLGGYQQDNPYQIQGVSPQAYTPLPQGNGMQVQPSWDDPNQFRVSNLRVL